LLCQSWHLSFEPVPVQVNNLPSEEVACHPFAWMPCMQENLQSLWGYYFSYSENQRKKVQFGLDLDFCKNTKKENQKKYIDQTMLGEFF